MLYVVYVYQKLLNLIDAFNCYQQKCTLAPFNLAYLLVHIVKLVRNIEIRRITKIRLHYDTFNRSVAMVAE